jgi:acyl-CoA thioester hydrolase
MENMYRHKVQYYETDKMGVVHHSNYIRWFEEARLDFMDKQGFSYKSFEDLGYISPVLSVECKYKKSVRFGETIKVKTKLVSYDVRHKFTYVITDAETDEIRATGETTHCNLDETGKVLMLKKKMPELYEKFQAMVEE